MSTIHVTEETKDRLIGMRRGLDSFDDVIKRLLQAYDEIELLASKETKDPGLIKK